jgi:hypothetical protein
MSKITPTLPGQSAKPPGNQLAASATAPQVDTDNPTIGSVLHQMFVVGDPDHPSTPSIGRANDRPP